MNIGGMISNIKQKMRDRQNKAVLERAQRLKEIKKERISLEGQNKIYRIENEEKERLSKAKKQAFQNRHPLVMSALKSLKEKREQHKKKMKQDNKESPKQIISLGNPDKKEDNKSFW